MANLSIINKTILKNEFKAVSGNSLGAKIDSIASTVLSDREAVHKAARDFRNLLIMASNAQTKLKSANNKDVQNNKILLSSLDLLVEMLNILSLLILEQANNTLKNGEPLHYGYIDELASFNEKLKQSRLKLGEFVKKEVTGE